MDGKECREIMAKLEELDTRIKRLNSKIDQIAQDVEYTKNLVISQSQQVARRCAFGALLRVSSLAN